jgi:MFS family permease
VVRSVLDKYLRGYAGLPRDVWVLAFVLFVNRIGMMVLPFLTLYLIERHGFERDAAGRVVSMYGVGSIAGVLGGGWLSDRFGARRVQLTSLCLTSVAILGLWLARGSLGISIAVLVMSLAAEIFRPANSTAIIHAAPRHLHARSFSLLSAVVCVGLSIGLPIGGLLAKHDYDWLFWIDSGTGVLAALVLWRFGPRSNARGQHADDVSAETAQVSAWRDGRFLVFLVLTAAAGTILFQFFSTLPVFLKREVGLGEDGVGLLLGFNTIIIALFQVQIAHAVERKPPLAWIALGALLMGLGYGLNGLSNGVLVAFASVLVWTVGEMLYFPLTAAFASKRAPPSALGRYMSAYHLSVAVPFVVAPLLGTEIYDRWGSGVLWASNAVAGVVIWLGFMVMARRSAARDAAV